MTKTIDRTSLEALSAVHLDANLKSELDALCYDFFFAAEFDGDFRTGNGLHIAYCPEAGRAGLVYVGSGSSGVTAWTDCDSAEDALRRYLDDEMQG
jgi:hypothetical protein